MLQHRGFRACIVDAETGRPIPEHLVALNSDKNQVSCWIPSKEGQRFSVHWEDLGGDVDTCAFILVDGIVVPGRFLFGIGKTFRSGIRTSENTERPFEFRKVAEDASTLTSSKDTGMIVLKIKRVKRLTGRPPDELEHVPRSPRGGRQVGDMYVGFGDEYETSEQWSYTWDVKPYDHDNPPGERGIHTHVSFVFRYRSHEFLQAQGILDAPSPSPVPAAPRLPASLPPLKPSSCPAPRIQVRRIVSAPTVPSSDTSSPNTPLSAYNAADRNHKWDPPSTPDPLANNPYRGLMKAGVLSPNTYHKLPGELRRATSWVPNDAIGPPGVGMIRFEPSANLDRNRIMAPRHYSSGAAFLHRSQ